MVREGERNPYQMLSACYLLCSPLFCLLPKFCCNFLFLFKKRGKNKLTFKEDGFSEKYFPSDGIVDYFENVSSILNFGSV